MKNCFFFCIVICFTFMIASCTTSDVITKSPGEHSVTSSVIMFQTLAGAKEKVYDKANSFCEKKGKVVKTINLKTRPMVVGRPGEASLTFTCIENKNNNK